MLLNCGVGEDSWESLGLQGDPNRYFSKEDIQKPKKTCKNAQHQKLLEKCKSNLDSILKSRDITLSTKVCLVKAMVFPVVMYGCESWTVEKAECRRIDDFELWCWRTWTVARQASLSFTVSLSLCKLMFIVPVMLSNHLSLCHPLLFLPSIFPNIRVFSNELAKVLELQLQD